MALQKQNYFLSITDGLDTKTDEKNVIPTRFLELENLIFTKTGQVSKRFGYKAVTKNILDGSELVSGDALTTFNDELLAYSGNDLYTFSEAENKWILKGPTNAGLAEISPVVSTGDIYTTPYFCNLENFSCYVYRVTGSSPGVYFRILDRSTGTTISSGTISGAIAPKVEAIENKFIISYIEAGTLKAVPVNVTTPSVLGTPITILASIANFQYDMRLVGNRIFFVGCTASSGSSIIFLNADLSASSPVPVEASGTQTQPDVSVSGINDVRVSYITSAPAVKTVIFNYDLISSSGVATISGDFPLTVSAVNKGTSSQLYITYKYNSSPASQNCVKTVNVTTAGSVSSVSTLFNQVMAQTKAVEYNGLDYFVICKDESELQQRTVRTYFLVNSAKRILAKFDEENSVVLSKAPGNSTYLTNLVLESDSVAFAGTALAEFQAEASTAGGFLTTPTTLKKYTTSFSASRNYFDAKLGQNLHIAGGILKAYDGTEVVEHGFLEIPRAPVAISQATQITPGMGLPSGPTVYQYVVVYAWRDSQGQLHRSAPSPAMTLDVPQVTPPNYYNAVIQVPTLTLTNKENVEIEIYRTGPNETTFHKLLEGGSGAYASRVFNDPTVPFISYTDTLADISENELLYTTGGVLENVAPAASKYVVTYKNRVFLLSADGKSLYYSKLREANSPVEFNDSLTIALDEFGGPATALAVMDDHVLIFKERAIFALTGEGPNNLGQQDDFRLPYLITSDAGCIDANSVIRTPDAIMFKSDKGIYEIQRNFQVAYIGAPVERYNSSTVSSATLLETTNEIRFTTSEGRTLVYDYFHKRWTTFTNMVARDALSYQNQYVYLRPDGTVMKETKDYYFDQGSYIKTKLVSAWISLAGIQGFQRLYQIELLGNYKASHKLRVSMAYDFVNSYLHDVVINATTVLNPSYYGVGTYGSETPYGGNGMLYQFQIFPKIQKCQSFKICIEDFPGTESGGEAYTLSNIAATVGIKGGLNRIAEGKTFGTR